MSVLFTEKWRTRIDAREFKKVNQVLSVSPYQQNNLRLFQLHINRTHYPVIFTWNGTITDEHVIEL